MHEVFVVVVVGPHTVEISAYFDRDAAATRHAEVEARYRGEQVEVAFSELTDGQTLTISHP